MVVEREAGGKVTPHWKVLESRYSFRDEWIGVRSDKVLLPDKAVLSPYHTIEFPDWVVVAALTPAQTLVVVEQYRHGAKTVMVELPAGSVDDRHEETPLAAMQRELLEETGYASSEWHHLGSYFANAARQSNKVHAYMALNAKKVAEQCLEHGENIEVAEVPLGEVTERLRNGRLNFAACHLACLFWLQARLDK